MTLETAQNAIYVLREMMPGDRSFIINSWLKSYRDSQVAELIGNEIYYREQARVVLGCLARSNVVVAVNPDDLDQIYGWVCMEPARGATIFHYVYVKFDFRKFGIAKALWLAGRLRGKIFYTHDVWESRGLAKKLGAIYNPYLTTPIVERKVA